MDGPDILVRTLSTAVPTGPSRALWQYHSQSDRHSKVACWGMLFDLMQQSALMREHMSAGKVTFGVNHSMMDWVNDKPKKLDLVLCRPDLDKPQKKKPLSFVGFADKYSFDLTADQRARLNGLPAVVETPVGAVLVATEAKACMTAHVKAKPRFFDELNSSHNIVHGHSDQALAVGLAMINAATRFVSPKMNTATTRGVYNVHQQPAAAQAAISVVKSLRRRSGTGERGYDGLGIVIVDMANDGSPVKLVNAPPAPSPGDAYRYENMISRIANEYDAAFRRI